MRRFQSFYFHNPSFRQARQIQFAYDSLVLLYLYCKVPQRIRGGAPYAKRFSCILEAPESVASPDVTLQIRKELGEGAIAKPPSPHSTRTHRLIDYRLNAVLYSTHFAAPEKRLARW